VPVPERATVCGLSAALSTNTSEPDRLPVAVGLKVMLTVQLAPAATVEPQLLLVMLKSLLPVIVSLVRFRVALPVLVNVTGCGELEVPTVWLPNERLVGDTLTTGAVPFPERATVWGLLGSESVRVTVALRLPLAVGLKVTLIEQLLPPARLEPQLLL
jgi:hypothetical protein